MKRTGRPRRPHILSTLESDKIRRTEVEGKSYYAIMDVLAAASDSDKVEGVWASLARREPHLAEVCEQVAFGDETHVGADLEGTLRILQALPGTKGESIRRWLASCGAEQLAESENPELAVARARQEYERLGYPRTWIDQRMRSISARAEVVGEWYKRGATTSEDFRTLTNTLIQESFGMDVESYRQHKGLFGGGGRENLRDHMNDMELALVSLGETVAATLHRSHGSKSVAELEADMRTAGNIVAETRSRIEESAGKPVIEGERRAPARRRNPRETAPPTENAGREVLYRRQEKQDVNEPQMNTHEHQ
jgi:hypothetical protein